MDPDNSYREEAPVSMASRSADDENESNPTRRSSSESDVLIFDLIPSSPVEHKSAAH